MSPIKVTNKKKDALNPHAEATIHITPYTAILRNKRRSSPGISSFAEWLAVIQGFYYCLRGLWPWVSPGSFMALAGSRTDWWGVHTGSSLLLVVGIVFLVAALRSVLSLELGLLMIGCCFSLGIVDTAYILKGSLLPFYMIDGIEEVAILAFSLVSLPHFTHRRHSTYL